MKKEMSGRERIMTALRHGIPDRVPSTPDMSIMIPVKMSGKAHYDWPDPTESYLRAMRYYGIDGWMFNGTLTLKTESKVTYSTKCIKDTYDVKEYVTTMHTPDGDLQQVMTCPRETPFTLTEKYVKDLKRDFKIIKNLFVFPTGYERTEYDEQRKKMGDDGMICFYIDCPGIQSYWPWMDIQELLYAYYDYPELFEELRELNDRISIKKTEIAADAKVESILTGGSGSITLQSPDIFRHLSLPTIKHITTIAKQAGILTGIHSCGKEYDLVKMCAEETDLDYVNPLEIPPYGDCTLAKVKEEFGSKIALMGNLHTTRVMLDTIEVVRLESLKAIRDAGQNGGFVLSTGDQCGPNTPEGNIFEIVRVAKEFGQYPLDMDKINDEIKRLENAGIKMVEG